MAAAKELLVRLGALDAAVGRVTPAGRRMANLPLHPRMVGPPTTLPARQVIQRIHIPRFSKSHGIL